MKVLALLSVLMLLAAGGILYYLHFDERNPYHRMSYAELQEGSRNQSANIAKMKETAAGSKSPVPGLNKSITEFEHEVDNLNRQIFLWRFSVVLGVASILSFGLSLLYFLYTLFSGKGRQISSGPKGSKKGFYHRGKILQESPKVLYINADDFNRIAGEGYATAQEAEDWIRTDQFLECTYCEVPVKAETIGSVQELTYYEEEHPGKPKEEIRHLGSIWIARPIDKFVCQKCGHTLIRSVR